MSIFKREPKPWLRGEGPYPGGEPGFYDPGEYDWVDHVESNWEVIRDELMDVIRKDQETLEPYKDMAMTDKKNAWRTAGLMYWTFESDKNVEKFPKTWSILKDIPNLTSCSMLSLEPMSSVKPHNGDTNAMVRCHMGLVVPAPLPRCGLRVGKESVSWKEGKIFMFNDAHEHTAWNNTNEHRYVLSFDVMRPEFVNKQTWVATRVLGRIYLEVMYQNHMWLWYRVGKKGGERLLLFLSTGLFRTLKYLRLPLYNLL